MALGRIGKGPRARGRDANERRGGEARRQIILDRESKREEAAKAGGGRYICKNTLVLYSEKYIGLAACIQ
jgi:hypothetical protein